MKYKVLIPQEVSEKGISYLENNNCECICLDDYSEESLCENVKDCDAILARTADFNSKVIETGKKLKIIARHGVGIDNIDLEAAKKNNIKVTITPGANSNSVAEHAIALILACAKQIPFFDKITRESDWEYRDTKKTIDVSEKVLGIIGYGRIGKLVAKKAALGLDMKVIVFRNHHEEELPEYISECDTLEEIFEKSDFISFHAPLKPGTEKLVNKALLEKMKRTAYFINTARGGSVDEEDLYDVINSGKIAGAGLDVFEQEPPSKNNKLFTLDNVVVSPHNAAHSVGSMDTMAYNAACEIVRVLNNEEPKWEIK